MPVWHAATKALRESGELVVIGIVQEQHPERAQLYAQWQEFDWPILWDPFNLLDLSAVPVICAVDDHGRVVSNRLDPRDIDGPKGLKKLLFEPSFEAPLRVPEAQALLSRSLLETPKGLEPKGPLGVLNSLAFFVFESRSAEGAADQFDLGVDRLRAWAERDGALPADQFRLGVALRLRYDSPYAKPDDFQASLDAWAAALAAKPSQYIWRRRIQQWGPRLDKPYSFYDWVDRATTEVAARGEVPIALRVSLTGSEQANRQSTIEASARVNEPDPKAEIPADEQGWLKVTPAIAVHSGDIGRGAGRATAAARVHLSLALNADKDVHWTNDAGNSVVWIETPKGWRTPKQHLVLDAPASLTSKETRRLDFGVIPDTKGDSPKGILRGYVLSYLCSGENGECRYLRTDFEVELPSSGSH